MIIPSPDHACHTVANRAGLATPGTAMPAQPGLDPSCQAVPHLARPAKPLLAWSRCPTACGHPGAPLRAGEAIPGPGTA